MEWQASRLSGNDPLAVRAGAKLRRDQLLVTNLGPTIVRKAIGDVPLWRGDHVPVRTLVEDFAQQLYLQRVAGPAVLAESLRDGVALLTWRMDTFAYAESLDDGAERYLGLRGGEQVAVDPRCPTAIENLWDIVEKGDLDTSDIQPRLHKHQSHKEELRVGLAEDRAVIEERRELLASADAVEKYAERLNGLLVSSSASAKKMFLRSFVKEILVERDGLVMRYTIPTPRESDGDPDPEEGGLPGVVPATVQYGRGRQDSNLQLVPSKGTALSVELLPRAPSVTTSTVVEVPVWHAPSWAISSQEASLSQ